MLHLWIDRRHGVKKFFSVVSTTLVSILFIVSILAGFSAQWTLETWPNLKMEELMFQFQQGLYGTGGEMFGQYGIHCVLPTLAVFIMMIGILVAMKGKPKHKMRVWMIIISIASLVCAGASIYSRVGVGDYIAAQTTNSEFIRDNYADPKEVDVVFPEQKRNLIYIFLESMEVTFTDKASGGAFDESYIPELTQLAKENEDFSGSDEKLNGGISLPYTTWTMGAMFGQTSGLPLQTSIDRNDMDTQLNFFPDIWTLGDILEKEGYNSTLLLGSDAVFGGRKTYFETHGNYEIRDYYWAGKHGYVPAGHYVWWGMEDSYLISMAKSTLDEYSAKGEPFNVTMLTVDTHFEDGYVCPDCDDEYDTQYSNVMACSSKRIAEFIDWCKEQPWCENTTIVITGDHPTMDVDYCENIDADYERKVYTCYINSAAKPMNPEQRRVFSTLDEFPTTLAAMGAYIEGDRLGLGTNLFSSRKTLTEEMGVSEETLEISKKSKFMESLSGIDLTSKDLLSEGHIVADATVKVLGYDREKETLKIAVKDIHNENGPIYRVMAVTENEKGSTIYEAQAASDGSWQADLIVPEAELETTGLRIVISEQTDDPGSGIKGDTVFTYSGASLLFLGSVQNDAAAYLDTLATLDKSRYAVFITLKDNAVNGITDEIQESLFRLGTETDLRGEQELYWFAVISDGTVHEDSSSSYLERYGVTSGGYPYIIVSSYTTAPVYIANQGYWGYEQYSNSAKGINVVVWDQINGEMANNAYFDTRWGVPQGDVRITQLNKEAGLMTIRIKDITGVRDGVADVKVTVFGRKNPRNQKTYQLDNTENYGWAQNIDISDIDITDAVIKIDVLNTSGEYSHLPDITGNLKEYQAAQTSVIAPSSEGYETAAND